MPCHSFLYSYLILVQSWFPEVSLVWRVIFLNSCFVSVCFTIIFNILFYIFKSRHSHESPGVKHAKQIFPVFSVEQTDGCSLILHRRWAGGIVKRGRWGNSDPVPKYTLVWWKISKHFFSAFVLIAKMRVIREKTSTLETTCLARKISVVIASMGNVNSFILHRRLLAGRFVAGG